MSARTFRRLKLNPRLLEEKTTSKGNQPVNLPFSTESWPTRRFGFSPHSSQSRNWNTVNIRTPHAKQLPFLDSTAKRKVIRAGRRGGKTVGIAILAVRAFQAGRRILYATPTQDQIERFWFEVKRALEAQTDSGRLSKNETKHTIERLGTENRIRAKTAWNADTLRGDYADLLILDEWQLMAEDAWEQVGAPMLLDNNGDVVFIYTPPSIRSSSTTKARDPMHAAKLFKRAQADTSGRWETFHFSSHDNPYLSTEGLAEISNDMTRLAYEQEILALDKEDNPAALWNSPEIEALRLTKHPELSRIVTAIDPSATSTGDEAGIVTAGIGECLCKGEPEVHGFVLEDASLQASPKAWASEAVTSYHRFKADGLIAESNNGGEMVSLTVGTVDGAPPVKLIHASRGKHTRAEPVAALYEHGRVHHVGQFGKLEAEMTMWDPMDSNSPNRLDALVWGLTELMLGGNVAFACE
jgi:hypothetical protein